MGIEEEIIAEYEKAYNRISHELAELYFWGGQNRTLQQVLNSPWPDRCRFSCYHKLVSSNIYNSY